MRLLSSADLARLWTSAAALVQRRGDTGVSIGIEPSQAATDILDYLSAKYGDEGLVDLAAFIAMRGGRHWAPFRAWLEDLDAAVLVSTDRDRLKADLESALDSMGGELIP